MKIIKNPNEIVDEFVADFRGLFGENLLSVVMYGSAASHEYQPGISDINTVIVLNEDSVPILEKCIDTATKWAKRRVAIPFFMTRHFIESAIDSYPVEFLDIRSNYRILFGEDFFAHLDIQREHIRLQCERELRGIAIHLRKEFIRCAGKSAHLQQLLVISMKKLLPVFKAMVVLNNKPVPKLRGNVIMAIEDIYNLGVSALSDAALHPIAANPEAGWAEMFDKFTKTIDKLITVIDGKD